MGINTYGERRVNLAPSRSVGEVMIWFRRPLASAGGTTPGADPAGDSGRTRRPADDARRLRLRRLAKPASSGAPPPTAATTRRK